MEVLPVSMPLAVMMATSKSREFARSALPDAPSLESSANVHAPRPEGRRVRRRTASALRRAADRLEPAPC
jgi:hypothetical protein